MRFDVSRVMNAYNWSPRLSPEPKMGQIYLRLHFARLKPGEMGPDLFSAPFSSCSPRQHTTQMPPEPHLTIPDKLPHLPSPTQSRTANVPYLRHTRPTLPPLLRRPDDGLD